MGRRGELSRMSNLIELVLDQILDDVAVGDITSIKYLLSDLEENALRSLLSEERLREIDD